MAARGGFIIGMGFPDFRARNSTPTFWSDSILTASRPLVSDVFNSSSNLALVSLGTSTGPKTDVAMTALHIKNHGTTRSRGFDTNHRGPCDLDAGGYDWFERIFLDPTSASIKVLNSTDLAIRTLSTYRNQAPGLASITLDTGAGTSMTTEPTYTYLHPLLTYLNVVFTATKAGPSSYTGAITFDYATGGEVFDITIVRVLDAPWRPLDKFTESLEWNTSIIPARSLETRAALREYPRITYDYEFLLLERELNSFRAAASNPEVPLLTPLWYDEYLVGNITANALVLSVDTITSEFVDGGYVHLSEEGGESEFVEITTVGAGVLNLDSPIINNYTNATATPATLTAIIKASYREFNNNVYKGKLSVVGFAAIERPTAVQTEHDSIGVLTHPSIIKKTLNAAFNTRGKYLDNGTGIVRFKAVENRVRNSFDHLWMALGYTDRKAMKDWIYSRVGRQKKFLNPTFQNDLFLAAPYAGGTSMDVLETHFETPFYFQVRLLTGAVYYGTCSSKTSSGGVDTLSIEALGVPFSDNELDAFSIMFENRYGSDKFKITYSNHRIAELKTTTTGI